MSNKVVHKHQFITNQVVISQSVCPRGETQWDRIRDHNSTTSIAALLHCVRLLVRQVHEGRTLCVWHVSLDKTRRM